MSVGVNLMVNDGWLLPLQDQWIPRSSRGMTNRAATQGRPTRWVMRSVVCAWPAVPLHWIYDGPPSPFFPCARWFPSVPVIRGPPEVSWLRLRRVALRRGVILYDIITDLCAFAV